MLVPLSKANELVEKIRPSLGDGKLLLSLFELKMLARDASKLSPDNHRWCVQGMLAFLNNDVEEGIRLCELAVAFDPMVTQSWCNYAAGLRYSGLFQKEWEVINRSIEYKGIQPLSYANTLAYCWADYELLNRTVNIIEAMEVSERLGDIQGMMYGKGMALRESLKNAGSEVAGDIRALGAIVRQLAEDERLPKLLSRVSCHEGEYAFIYQVETDDVNYLLKLDNMLFDRIIEAGIKSKNCIAFFEAASEGEE